MVTVKAKMMMLKTIMINHHHLQQLIFPGGAHPSSQSSWTEPPPPSSSTTTSFPREEVPLLRKPIAHRSAQVRNFGGPALRKATGKLRGLGENHGSLGEMRRPWGFSIGGTWGQWRSKGGRKQELEDPEIVFSHDCNFCVLQNESGVNLVSTFTIFFFNFCPIKNGQSLLKPLKRER